MSKTALIGHGYWGKNILRNLINIVGVNQVVVIEQNEAKLEELRKIFPNLLCGTDHSEVIKSKGVSNVVIATPTPTHYELAKLFLENNKNVLIEKPATMDFAEAKELGEIAKEKGVCLMTDYTFLYNPAIEKIKEIFDSKELGNINYIDCTRINLGIHQKETNVLWDLACHDVSIVNYLIDEKPAYVRAIGRVNKTFNVEELAYVFLHYPSGLLIQINASWASPVKIRQIVIGGQEKMLIFDDLEPTNKLKIYDYDNVPIEGDDSKQKLTEYRLGNVSFPIINSEEPLNNVIRDFLESANKSKSPKIEYQETLEIIKYLEKANESMKNNGELVKI